MVPSADGSKEQSGAAARSNDRSCTQRERERTSKDYRDALGKAN